jgi:hypothetical protein
MPIFETSRSSDNRYFEGYVLAVDIKRAVCKIQTDYGQSLNGVPWISSIYDSPEFTDRVLVISTLGYPIIVGILPRVGLPTETATPIDTGESEADPGNYSALSQNLVNDPLKPWDMVGGDKIFSNQMGGLFGLLRGGTFIAKASKLAQILISKYDDLVRIVGRNYEVFTDLSSDIIASVRGRVYRFIGYSDTLANGRGVVYKYREYYGDTVLGGLLHGDYYGQTPSSFEALTAADAIIRKYKIVSGANTLFYQDLYHDTGRYYTKVQNVGATAYTYIDQTNAIVDVKADNGTDYTRIEVEPQSVTVTYNGVNTIKISGIGVTITAPVTTVSDVLTVGNGASGTFTTGTGTIVTVQDGIVTNIYP